MKPSPTVLGLPISTWARKAGSGHTGIPVCRSRLSPMFPPTVPLCALPSNLLPQPWAQLPLLFPQTGQHLPSRSSPLPLGQPPGASGGGTGGLLGPGDPGGHTRPQPSLFLSTSLLGVRGLGLDCGQGITSTPLGGHEGFRNGHSAIFQSCPLISAPIFLPAVGSLAPLGQLSLNSITFRKSPW